jgi:hypothetical protein
MNEKALMRKTKAELMKILGARGEKPNPKTLKKDLVKLIMKSSSPPEKGADGSPAPEEAGMPQPDASRSAERLAGETQQAGDEPAAPAETVAPGPLPRRYGEDRITAMVRDPHWIFAYWEVTPQGLEHARGRLDGEGERANLALRVYDISGITFTGDNANSSFDIEVGEDADNWYIQTGRPGRAYCVDIGLLGRGGAFQTIARSECVSTPRATPSEQVDDRWMSPEGEFEQVYALSGGLEAGAASPDLHELMQKQLHLRISS